VTPKYVLQDMMEVVFKNTMEVVRYRSLLEVVRYRSLLDSFGIDHYWIRSTMYQWSYNGHDANFYTGACRQV
jgi:hypothetical protein